MYTRSICCIILALASSSLYGQSSLETHANTYYHNLQYADAVPVYERLVRKDPKNRAALTNLADCYRHLNDPQNAERVYRVILSFGNATGGDHLHFAEALAANGKYKEAQREYSQYLRFDKTDRRADNNIAALQHPERFTNVKTVNVIRLAINSGQEDFAPSFYGNGILFASGRTRKAGIRHIFGWNNGSFLDLYYSGELTDPFQPSIPHPTRLKGSINSIYHEGPSSIFASGDSMIFTRNNYANKLYRTDKLGVNRLKLYSAHRDGDKWERIRELPINSNDYSVGHPALNATQDTLYFVSDMPGGEGETAIWMVAVNNGRYGIPVNCGRDINTEGREMFPYIDASGNLTFASDGHGGLGGLDIFYSPKINGRLQPPINAGAPLNSRSDDFGLIVAPDGTTGYFSSYRNGKESADDLYFFKSAESIIRTYVLQGTVADRDTHQMLPSVTVQLADSTGLVVESVLTTANGSFTIPLKPDNKYRLLSTKEKYFETTDSISTKDLMPGQPLYHHVMMNAKGLYSLSLEVTDRTSHDPVSGATVTIREKTTGKIIASGPTARDGILRLPLNEIKSGDRINYTVSLERAGYLSKTVPLIYVFREPGEIMVSEAIDLAMDKIEVGADIGKMISVNPIYFDVNKSTVRADAARELDKIVAVMRDNPGMKIELGSHTDSRGSDAANLALSDKRAKASAAYIISQGISTERITGKGYGESRLVNKCGNGVKCTEAQHQMNRRTEFIIVSLSGE